jgi:hypothetical protein
MCHSHTYINLCTFIKRIIEFTTHFQRLLRPRTKSRIPLSQQLLAAPLVNNIPLRTQHQPYISIASSFDQEVAAILMARIAVFKAEIVCNLRMWKYLEHRSREAPFRRVQCAITSDQCVSGWESFVHAAWMDDSQPDTHWSLVIILPFKAPPMCCSPVHCTAASLMKCIGLRPMCHLPMRNGYF